MANIHIQDENRTITDVQEMEQFLKPFGIWYEKWEVENRVDADASNEDILDAYAPEIEKLKETGGFVTTDVINVTPETPGLDQMLEKFNKEHTHSEDEVRFTVKGQGVFHIHPENGPVFAVHVESGDLINVPRGTRHWFDMCEDKTIRCIRLFEDPAGWTPHYIVEGVHSNYTPLCWGNDYIPAEQPKVDPVIEA